jgi:hypothetical protein
VVGELVSGAIVGSVVVGNGVGAVVSGVVVGWEVVGDLVPMIGACVGEIDGERVGAGISSQQMICRGLGSADPPPIGA